jgi:hypothetical protein
LDLTSRTNSSLSGTQSLLFSLCPESGLAHTSTCKLTLQLSAFSKLLHLRGTSLCLLLGLRSHRTELPS